MVEQNGYKHTKNKKFYVSRFMKRVDEFKYYFYKRNYFKFYLQFFLFFLNKLIITNLKSLFKIENKILLKILEIIIYQNKGFNYLLKLKVIIFKINSRVNFNFKEN